MGGGRAGGRYGNRGDGRDRRARLGEHGRARTVGVAVQRATTIVWLDYSLPVILWQLYQRTMKRIISREELWNGNRETVRGTFFSKDSLFLWALQTYPRYRQQYLAYQSAPEWAHLQIFHLRSRRETASWLAQLEKKQVQNSDR